MQAQEQKRVYMRQWLASHPEARAKASARSREWYAANKERAGKRVAAWQRANKDRIKAARRTWRAANPGAARSSHLKARYGLTTEAFEALLDAQNGKCAICAVDLRSARVHIDHDHTTQRVRGILCQGCNHGLGGFRDSRKSLAAAICYLRRNT